MICNSIGLPKGMLNPEVGEGLCKGPAIRQQGHLHKVIFGVPHEKIYNYLGIHLNTKRLDANIPSHAESFLVGPTLHN
ncbi:hypothetical protein CRG98_034918 [Punica granatum]|uniref:Uncharacterized protein n=1 Tax=Punica granatum TaxID=22663 RepID=A0A2I0IL24_PUNGR|nr:hypothetical protein CRG98_034918 [Punica granatum]